MLVSTIQFTICCCRVRAQRIIEEPEVIEAAAVISEEEEEEREGWGERRHLSVDSDEERYVTMVTCTHVALVCSYSDEGDSQDQEVGVV